MERGDERKIVGEKRKREDERKDEEEKNTDEGRWERGLREEEESHGGR